MTAGATEGYNCNMQYQTTKRVSKTEADLIERIRAYETIFGTGSVNKLAKALDNLLKMGGLERKGELAAWLRTFSKRTAEGKLANLHENTKGS